jgi:hypothetical protein
MDKWRIFGKSDIECVMFGIRLTQCLPYGMEHINDVPVHIALSNRRALTIARMVLGFCPLYSRLQVLFQGRSVRIKPNETAVSPIATIATSHNATTIKTKGGTSGLNPVPTLDKVALLVILINIAPKCIAASLCSRAIVDIVPMVTPLQVVNAIIGLVLILVVNLWVVVGVWYKGECYKPMYLATMSLSTVAKVNTQIALPANTGLHTFALATLTRGCLNPSEVTNLVDTFGVNVFPNFFHISWPKKRKGAYCRGLGQEMILSRNNSPIMGLSNVLLARPRYKEITRFHNKYTTLL